MGSVLGLIHDDLHALPLKTEFQNLTSTLQQILATLGVWVPVSDPTLFTGNNLMTWTVEARDQVAVAYAMFGNNTMLLNMSIDTSSVGGTVSNRLRMYLPAGKTAKRSANAACEILDNGAAGVLGSINAVGGLRYVDVIRFDAGNYTASTDLTYIRGQIFVEVL